MELATPLLLSGSGLVVAALAFYNRDRPAWQRGMGRLMFVALMQVTLGVLSWIVLSR